jgi:predicted metal-dependent HD superfamily phosphohydrolase
MKYQFLLNKYKIKANLEMLLDMWNESHRSYHNLNHLMDISDMILEDFLSKKIDEKTYEKLILTNLFHDIVYNPTRKDNESKSAEFFMNMCMDKANRDILEIKEAILATATHKSTNLLSEKFNKYDMNIVERDFNSLLEWEKGISVEYSFAGDQYKNGRLVFLESLLPKYPLNNENLLMLIEHVKAN